MEICRETIKLTIKCNHDFICLDNSNFCCKVKDCISNEVHFVDRATNKICPYAVPFGYAFICNCPVRKEIFNRYGV